MKNKLLFKWVTRSTINNEPEEIWTNIGIHYKSITLLFFGWKPRKNKR